MPKREEVLKRYGIRGSPTTGLIAGTIAFFAGFAAVALFGITVHTVAPLLHLNIIEVGWLVAIPLVTGALLRIPFGALVDNVGGRRIILTQLIIAIIGMIGLILTLHAILTHSIGSSILGYALLMLFGAVAGTGISTFASGIAYVSYWFPQRRQGYALGAYAGFGNAAPGIFTAILPYALAGLGLIGAYTAWAVFLVIMTAVFTIIGYDAYYFQLVKRVGHNEAERLAKELGEELIPSGSAIRSLSESARIWRTWLLVIMYFISFGGFEALTEWLPTYWTNYLSLGIAMAGFMTGVVYSLITALMRVPGGWFSDKWSGERVAIISYIILVIGSIIMMLSHNFALSTVGTIVMAIGMGIANAAVFKLVPKYVPEAVGGATGWVGGLGSAGGLLIPPAMATFVAIYGHVGYALGFMIYTVFGSLSIIFAIILYWHEHKHK
ncbi:MFS transporter [Vulcanisaeta souniana]|uniref:NarK/NasA family nitrate transporter n=1 Tax=Vulcanisaeta souniana JCM 11219 TaxID=1293586 RepID=A0A830EIE6_9CREN|nr:MFS transporter [Vulcanisaeta souniana]BDR92945.1 NarK/NasA family nitrate transporter [Vulcanisaeta souniana JCM 11219]GGI85853.1 putative nitrate transporter NarT [Vulcanisaeta souniana JCM 11219]